MFKGSSIKEALARWEQKNEKKAADATEIKLSLMMPPIDKMDATLATIPNCEFLSLSTNMIDKIANLNALKNLKILSLGRNNIKNLNGLDAVGETLTELWISYNLIEKLKGVHVLKNLEVLYMSCNMVKDWAEFQRLTELPCLVELVFIGNPLEQKHSSEGDWIEKVSHMLKPLKKLDGAPLLTGVADD